MMEDRTEKRDGTDEEYYQQKSPDDLIKAVRTGMGKIRASG
nr:hypothetical protein [Salmonella sp.]